MRSISPVYNADSVDCERVIALDQPEYEPIIILPLVNYTNPMMTRWEFSEEERKIIAEGGELVLTELTFSNAFTPLAFEVLPKGEQPRNIDIVKLE